jgi:L-2-hydroxyglutarate oxidase LhgO
MVFSLFMQRYDYAIIGGGIVRLSAARAILERQSRDCIAILEKGSDWSRHQTVATWTQRRFV